MEKKLQVRFRFGVALVVECVLPRSAADFAPPWPHREKAEQSFRPKSNSKAKAKAKGKAKAKAKATRPGTWEETYAADVTESARAQRYFLS